MNSTKVIWSTKTKRTGMATNRMQSPAWAVNDLFLGWTVQHWTGMLNKVFVQKMLFHENLWINTTGRSRNQPRLSRNAKQSLAFTVNKEPCVYKALHKRRLPIK